MKNIFLVKDDFIDSRFDRWFRRNLYKAPQSFIEKHLRRGNIKINNKKIKSSYKLQQNDKIFVYNIKFSQKKIVNKSNIYLPTNKELSFSSRMII